MDRSIIEMTDAARLCAVGTRTLARWLEEDGKAAFRLSRGRAVFKRDLRRVLKLRGFPVPLELFPWPQVFVAEDDPAASRLEARILRSLWPDAEVLEVSDGNEAAAEILHRHFDLLVLDVNLPRTTGLELCSLARDAWRLERTRILVLTGRGDTETNELAFMAGADEFMPKPFSKSDLERSARRLLLR